MQRAVWVLLLRHGSAFATAARVGACERADAAWYATGEPLGKAVGVHGSGDGLVMLALQHFLEKRPSPDRWTQGQKNFMVRHLELSLVRGPRVCGEPSLGAWGALGSFPGAEYACNDACVADPRCGYAVFQVESGECTGFAECSIAASVANQSGTFIVNERTAYACTTSPSWCGACKRAGMSAAAADSCRVVSGEWHCAGVATCVAAGGTGSDSSADCTPGTLVCAGRGPRAGQAGSGLEQAAAVIAALDVRGAHPACPRFAPGAVLREAALREAAESERARKAFRASERAQPPALREKLPEKVSEGEISWWPTRLDQPPPVRDKPALAAAQLGGGAGDTARWSSDLQPEGSKSQGALEWTIASLRNEVHQLRQTLNARDAASSLSTRFTATAAHEHEGAATASSGQAPQSGSMTVVTAQRVCTAEDKATMNPKWLQDGSRLEQMCSVYSAPPEYKSQGDMPPPTMWRPEEGTPECCDAGQSCEVAGFRILQNYLTLYSLCVPTANWTAT